LAAARLDKLWDESMLQLSEGYAVTLSLVEEGKTEEAYDVFREDFVAPFKKLYSEAAEIYPLRFSKIEEWCKWTKRTYIWTRKTEDLLKGAEGGGEVDREEAVKYLLVLREHFYVMHREAKILKSNDYIYSFYKELLADEPELAALKAARDALDRADPSMKATAESDAFATAKSAWLGNVAPILDGPALAPAQLDQLRTSTGPFYRAFGMQFE